MHPGENENPSRANNSFSHFRLVWLFLILLGAALVYFISLDEANRSDAPAAKSEEFKRADAAIAVAAEAVAQGDFPVYLDGLGTVTALHTVTVRSRVDGELLRVAFSEGQMVREGDLLAEIDPRAFQSQRMQAEGQLLRDEALLKNARIDLDRYKTLLEQDSIAAQQTFTQESLVKQYEGIVEIDRAQLENAKLQLEYTRITAPITGRLGLRLVDPGNIVNASDTNGLVVITQIKPIAVLFSLPEDHLPAVMQRMHQEEPLMIEAFDRAGQSRLAQGKLAAVDNQIDPSTGTIKLKGEFENADRILFPNQFVNIRVTLNILRDIAIIPSSSIQRGIPGAFVYVVVADSQSVSVRPIKIAATEAEKVAVLEGLRAGELVVVDGADKLREGAKINIVSSQSRFSPEPASGP